MRITSKADRASILIIALLSITVMTLICATSLYVTSQNAQTGMQTASWQQALTGAESGVDAAIRALNTGTWTNWKTVTGMLPAIEPPSGTGSNATAAPQPSPSPGQYNYLPSSALGLTMQGEGATGVSAWVTVDTAGMSASPQWYRVRATGQSAVSGPPRVSANKLDVNLRNTIALRFNRKGGTTLGPSRTIEVILSPVSPGVGITMKGWLKMSGGGVIDSFDSGDFSKSNNGLYDATKRQSNVGIGLLQSNNTASNLGNTSVYGNIQYSGPVLQNTSHVQGTISTPFNATIPTPVDPVSDGSNGYIWTYPTSWASSQTSQYQWTTGTYTAYSGVGNLPTDQQGNPSITASGSASSPTLIIINGDLTVSGNTSLMLNSSTPNSYVTIWVKGNYTTSGTGSVTQASGVKATWIVDGNITTTGTSYNNGSGAAANTSFVGVGTNNKTATISGNGNFIGTLNAPGYGLTISGTGSWSGAVIGNNLTISGGAGFHYDQALNENPLIGNYAFASWFEDNSDKQRGITY